MEDILGGSGDPARFTTFLADWRTILTRRTEEAIAVFSAIAGVRGLVLAGSVGRGEPWPLSDIDVLVIHDDDRIAEGRTEIDRRSVDLHARWHSEGWWTGVDIGKLAFGHQEVTRVLALTDHSIAGVLHDDRWYHSLDKGYQGRAVFDPDGVARELVRWLTTQRFSPSVVRLRLARERREVEDAYRRLRTSLERGDLLAATLARRDAGKWVQIWLLELWGERDASLARVGTRFENVARAHGHPELVNLVNRLSDLDEGAVQRRMAAAPTWVWEWHNRAWQARQAIGESVTPLQHARDVLRVCSLFELRRESVAVAVAVQPLPAWLAIPADLRELSECVTLLADLLHDTRPPTSA